MLVLVQRSKLELVRSMVLVLVCSKELVLVLVHSMV